MDAPTYLVPRPTRWANITLPTRYGVPYLIAALRAQLLISLTALFLFCPCSSLCFLSFTSSIHLNQSQPDQAHLRHRRYLCVRVRPPSSFRLAFKFLHRTFLLLRPYRDLPALGTLSPQPQSPRAPLPLLPERHPRRHLTTRRICPGK
jgi:hypothetical protein